MFKLINCFISTFGTCALPKHPHDVPIATQVFQKFVAHYHTPDQADSQSISTHKVAFISRLIIGVNLVGVGEDSRKPMANSIDEEVWNALEVALL